MTVQEIESAIAQLAPEELAQLAAWFDEFYAAAWDRQIESDVRAGRLDALVKEASDDFADGRCKPL